MGNKYDKLLDKNKDDYQTKRDKFLNQMRERYTFTHIECSAKNNYNIELIFENLMEKMQPRPMKDSMAITYESLREKDTCIPCYK